MDEYPTLAPVPLLDDFDFEGSTYGRGSTVYIGWADEPVSPVPTDLLNGWLADCEPLHTFGPATVEAATSGRARGVWLHLMGTRAVCEVHPTEPERFRRGGQEYVVRARIAYRGTLREKPKVWVAVLWHPGHDTVTLEGSRTRHLRREDMAELHALRRAAWWPYVDHGAGGGRPKGSRSGYSVGEAERILNDMRGLRARGVRLRVIADRFSFSERTVRRWLNGQ